MHNFYYPFKPSAIRRNFLSVAERNRTPQSCNATTIGRQGTTNERHKKNYVLSVYVTRCCRRSAPRRCLRLCRAQECDKNIYLKRFIFLLNRDREFDYCARTEAICIYRCWNLIYHKCNLMMHRNTYGTQCCTTTTTTSSHKHFRRNRPVSVESINVSPNFYRTRNCYN